MNVNYEKMCKWELEKAIFLQSVAVKLGMDVSVYGEVSVNHSSGYVYLWLEDYNFSLYMPINCDLIKTDVSALWTNSENGEEEEMSLENSTTLSDIEEWVDSCETDSKGDASRA